MAQLQTGAGGGGGLANPNYAGKAFLESLQNAARWILSWVPGGRPGGTYTSIEEENKAMQAALEEKGWQYSTATNNWHNVKTGEVFVPNVASLIGGGGGSGSAAGSTDLVGVAVMVGFMAIIITLFKN